MIGVRVHDREVGVVGEGAARVAAFVCSDQVDTPLHLQLRDTDTGIALTTRTGTVETFADETLAAEALMRELTQALIWDYQSGLALHAGMVEGGVLLAAMSGSGKSTLTTYLTETTGTFCTDELVFVPLGEVEAFAQPRPMHLKPGSEFLHDVFPRWRTDPAVWRGPSGTLLSAAAFPKQRRHAPVRAIVLPRYRAGAPLEWRRLQGASAPFGVLNTLLNARNLPGDGVPAMAALCAKVPVYTLSYSRLDEASAFVRSLPEGPHAPRALL